MDLEWFLPFKEVSPGAMKEKWNALPKYFKVVSGILVFALIIGGFLSYLAWREKPIVYRFNPRSSYVYTFHQDFYSIDYRNPPEKSVTVFSDGFNPTCVIGCRKEMEKQEVESSLIMSPVSGNEEEKKREPRFLYLEPGNRIFINFDMGKGRSIEEKYPFVDRLILETKGEVSHDSVKIAVRGYEFGDRKEGYEETVTKSEHFTFAEPFGDSFVFDLDNPIFAAQIIIEPGQESDGVVGFRNLGVYLERLDYRSIIANLEPLVREPNEGSTDPGEVKEKLSEALSLDPYSPRTHFLLSRINYELGNFVQARAEIDLALEKKDKYEEFLTDSVGVEDLFAHKAKIAEGLENWNVAIDYMNRTVPEVNHRFLSRIYLKKYEESEKIVDLKSSFYHATLSFKEIPRTCLEVLEKYKVVEGWSRFGLRYFEEEITETEKGRYRLSEGEIVSPYVVNLSRGLLGLWSKNEVSSSRIMEWLDQADDSVSSTEESALIKAVKARIYESIGEEENAEKMRSEAEGFFDNYSGLYTKWSEFVG